MTSPNSPQSPWAERRFLTECLTLLLQARLVGPIDPPDADGLDWHIVAAEAGRHGVAPLLLLALGERPQSCPETIWQTFLDQTDRTARLNALALIRLNELLAAFARAGLPAPILLKGASLLHTLYPRLALRPMQDLDILIDREQRREATAVAETLGYRLQLPAAPSPWHAEVLAETETRLSFVSSSSPPGLPLEGHLTLQEWPEANLTELRTRALAAGADGAPCRVLSPPDELLLLLLHLHRHQRPEVGGAGRLLWWFEVAARLAGMPEHWDEFAALLDTLPAPRRAQAEEILAFAGKLFAVKVPQALGLSLDDDARSRQAGALWAPPAQPRPDLPWMLELLRSSSRLASPFAKARFAGGYLLPPPAYLSDQYALRSPQRQALWYLARPLDLLTKLARVLLRR